MKISELEKEFEQQLESIQKPNVMIVGGTGVGKSSLINQIFGKVTAQTGSGKPVTKGCIRYEYANINIFDTEGYEIVNGSVDNSNFYKIVLNEIRERKEQELKNHIHVFWYCLSITNHRITPYDLSNIIELNNLGVKLAIVLTKCDGDELDGNNNGITAAAFKKELHDSGIKNVVFETMAESKDETLDLEALIEWSSENLPNEELRQSFISAQKASLTQKDQSASKLIATISLAATAAGAANPLPLSDAAVLTPMQIGMAVQLARIYGLDSYGQVALSVLKSQLLSIIGKQTAASLTKLIPVVGQVINASVAGAITMGVGKGLKYIFRNAYLDYLEKGVEPDFIKLLSDIDFSNFIKDSYKSKS